MFSQNNDEPKLDWMYKGANSLVDREDYLLGRTIDKTLEQLNAEEKQKASNQLPQPKNHVEHECIPPSIRDYNKISLADQVDLAAKLQEDPLVAIRKKEEETRKQFLQNPIQLKKLQKALKSQHTKKQSKKKKKKHSKSDKDLDAKLLEKLNQLKKNPLGLDIDFPTNDKDKDGGIDNVLIHKFNKLKNKLTEKDITAILEGRETSSDEYASSEDANVKGKSRRNNYKQRNYKHDSSDSDIKKKFSNKHKRKKYDSSDNASDSEDTSRKQSKYKNRNVSGNGRQERRNYESRNRLERYNDIQNEHYSKSKNENYSKSRNEKFSKQKSNRERKDSSNSSSDDNNKQNKYKNRDVSKNRGRDERKYYESRPERYKVNKQNDTRGANYSKSKRHCSDDEESSKQKSSRERKDSSNSSSDDDNNKTKTNWGLVTHDGKKIELSKNKSKQSEKSLQTNKPTATITNYKTTSKLSEAEKDKRRQEMMQNAAWRDKEREINVKKYREEDSKETKQLEYNPDFIHNQLLKASNTGSVESRIKSNLNNIQRSSKHMDKNFSRRH